LQFIIYFINEILSFEKLIYKYNQSYEKSA
jgi:hypothetical protein